MSELSDERKRRLREQLERVLASAAFAGSERHRRFLRFIVEQALHGSTDKLNEFVIGFEVFNKNETFDPRIDSIVRVEARRLRERLKKYYDEEGRADPVVITIRPRSFVPEFHDRTSPGTEAGASVDGSTVVGAAAADGALAKRHPWHFGFSVRFSVLAAIVATLGVIGGGLWWFFRKDVKSGPPPMASLLVLPFQPLSPVAEQQMLGDGIADSVITELAGMPGLRLISRGTGVQFKSSADLSPELAANLHVDYVVEGTVRAQAGRVTVSAKLTDVRSQSYLWAETRDTDAAALNDVERGLAQGILSHLRLPRPPNSPRDARSRARSSNPEAYASFLKGQYSVFQWDRGSLEQSITLFERCVALDSNYAPGWAWLSLSYQLSAMRQDGQDATAQAKGTQAAARALQLDDQLAEGYIARGGWAALSWDWIAAAKDMRRGMELNPEWAQGHVIYALQVLIPTGQTGVALKEVLRAQELDPLSPISRTILIDAFYFHRDFARTIAEAEEFRRSRSGPAPGDRPYLLALSLTGRGPEALTKLRASVAASGGRSPELPLLGYLEAKFGDAAKAREILNGLERGSSSQPPADGNAPSQEANAAVQRSGPPNAAALIRVGFGDIDGAMKLFRAAVDQHRPSAAQIPADPAFAPLHARPEYPALVRRMNLDPGR